MKKTKIICSIGPASSDIDVMRKMIEEGMDVIRINFSHARYEDVVKIISTVNELRKETGRNISILYDTKGPDFRCGEMDKDGALLEVGKNVKVVKENVVGNNIRFSVNHSDALDKIKVGNNLLLDDGLMKLEVIGKSFEGLLCRVIEGGLLKSRKSINVPSVDLNLKFMSEKDVADIKFSCEHDGDFLALSFVESKENIDEVRELLEKYGGGNIQIISKIESSRALVNLDEIISASDGIMVARGDLGVEVPLEKLPIIQKDIIKKCREKGKSVIVATEMLASMYTNPRPTRAEVTDISNAVLDGADAVMLSGESTVGSHPIESVKYMSKICKESEKYVENNTSFTKNADSDVTEAIAKAVLSSSEALKVKAIVVPTSMGHSAMVMSNLRPKPLILAICPNEKVARRLSLSYGVITKICPVNDDDMDDVVKICRKEAIKKLNLEKKDTIIITGGIHDKKNIKQTNFLKIDEI